MKPRFLIFTFLLLGFVGMESVKEEQFRHLLSNISGHSLPVAVSLRKQKDLKCSSKKERTPLASSRKSQKKDETTLTCFLLYKSGKGGFLTCDRYKLNPPLNSQIL
jgi:hypothetical protein